MWIFGYGSIIWRPGFTWTERREGYVEGFVRRFWQGSPDHRGVPEAPGRVVTLVPETGARCWGVAYRLDEAQSATVLGDLDVREQGGYVSRQITVHTRAPDGRLDALTYLAPPGNAHWLGPAPTPEMVRQIAASEGPSGHNAAYLQELAAALRAIGIEDAHVSGLAEALDRISA
jgi:cation transport regulator ChaC